MKEMARLGFSAQLGTEIGFLLLMSGQYATFVHLTYAYLFSDWYYVPCSLEMLGIQLWPKKMQKMPALTKLNLVGKGIQHKDK